MPTEGLRIAESGAVVYAHGSITDATQLCDDLKSALIAAGWSLITKTPAKMQISNPGGMPVQDPPPEGWELQPYPWNPPRVATTIGGYRFVFYDPTRYFPPVGTNVVPVPMAATMQGTADAIADKIEEYTIWDVTVSQQSLGAWPNWFVFDLVVRPPGEWGPRHNDDEAPGSLWGMSVGGMGRLGGYVLQSAPAPVTGSSLNLWIYEEIQPHGRSAEDRHLLKLDTTVSGEAFALPLRLDIGNSWGAPQGPYHIIAGPHQLFVFDQVAGRSIAMSCPWVPEDKGITHFALVTGNAAALIVPGGSAFHSMALYSAGGGIWVALNGPLREFGVTDDHPTFMGRAFASPDALLTRSGKPVIQTAYLAATDGPNLDHPSKICGLLWDTCAISDGRYSVGDRMSFGGRVWMCVSRADGHLGRTYMSLWAAIS